MATMTETAAAVAAHDMIELVPITDGVLSQVPYTLGAGDDSEAAPIANPEQDPNARPAAFGLWPTRSSSS
ncbi:hypothetical protein PG987_015870 [Apiospora arundinis]